MEKAKLDKRFIVAPSELARADEGVFDLTALWQENADNAAEQEQVIADIQESIDDYKDAPSEPLRKPYIKYDKLGEGGSGEEGQTPGPDRQAWRRVSRCAQDRDSAA